MCPELSVNYANGVTSFILQLADFDFVHSESKPTGSLSTPRGSPSLALSLSHARLNF